MRIIALVMALCLAFPAWAQAGDGFSVSEITPEIFARIKGKSFKDNCPLPLSDLRYFHVLHKDLDGNTHEGEIICNTYIAYDVVDIFMKLYDAGYPIEKVRLVDEYGADDETSMRDNNSSSFNFRFISHTTKISKHGLGLAVDINTLYNPYPPESTPTGQRISPTRLTLRICATSCSPRTASSGAATGRALRTTSISRSQTR